MTWHMSCQIFEFLEFHWVRAKNGPYKAGWAEHVSWHTAWNIPNLSMSKIHWNKPENRAWRPQFHIIWYQSWPIWLSLSPWPPNRGLLGGRMKLEDCEDAPRFSEVILFRSLLLVEKSEYTFYNQWDALSHSAAVGCIQSAESVEERALLASVIR